MHGQFADVMAVFMFDIKADKNILQKNKYLHTYLLRSNYA